MRVLIISDNKIASSYLRRLLVHAGNEAVVSDSIEEAMNNTAEFDPDLVVLELNLPGTSHDYARQKIEEIKKVPILPVSAYSVHKDARVDDFQVALAALRDSNNVKEYFDLIEALLGEKVT